MKHEKIISRNAWWLACALFSCSSLSVADIVQPIAAESLREDFRIMRQALEQAHGGIYWYTSKKEMDRTFDRAYRAIDHPITDLEFWRLITPVVIRIKCGHTCTWFPKRLQTEFLKTTLFPPFEMRVLDDRMYVYQDYTSGRPFEGSEVLSINNVPAKKLLAQLRELFTGDGNSATAKDWRIDHQGGFTVYLWGIGIQSPFRITYRDKNGERGRAELIGMNIPDRVNAWEKRNPPPETNADLMFVNAGDVAVLTIRHWETFVDPKRKVTFLDFLKTSFAQIQEKGSSNLVIDVRDNVGGEDAPGKQLFAFLWDKPFYYDADINMNAREFDYFKYAPGAKPVPADRAELQDDGKYHLIKHPNLGLQQPAQPNFRGRVFALMNGGSFSTSSEFPSVLHFHKRAKLIGEEAPGNYYGCTAGRIDELVLPHSGVIVGVPIASYYQAVSGYKYRDRGVLPDYPVRYMAAEMLAGKDKEMEVALSLAKAEAKQKMTDSTPRMMAGNTINLPLNYARCRTATSEWRGADRELRVSPMN